MKWLKWFLAGALAVPLAHQPVVWLLHLAGVTPRTPYPMQPTQPFGVPQTLSLAFWGGVWGILLGLVLLRFARHSYWVVAAIFGAIAPTLVAGFVIAPLRGTPPGGDVKLLMIGLLVNLAWGVGTAALYKMMEQRT